jgi:hypothetical protein
MLTDNQRREWLALKLDDEVEIEIREHKFTVADAEKLRLAGRGDQKRFFERVETDRVRFEAARMDSNRAAMQFLNDLRPLCASFEHGPYGDGSIFDKTLRTLVKRKSAAASTP